MKYSLFFIIFICLTSCAQNKGTFIDERDGQTYKWIKIGSQIWMAENLNYETETGSLIYEDDSTNANTYGRLYDWKTSCAICPEGWHLPNEQEWITLIDYNGGNIKAGNKLKEKGEKHWHSTNIGVTNESGFTALPGGAFAYNQYMSILECAYFWTSTEKTKGFSWACYFPHNDKGAYWSSSYMGSYYSVRCIKD